MSKAYNYGGPGIGVFETRHEAIGAAAIEGREHGDKIMSPYSGPKSALKLVGPIPQARCGFCGEVFDYESELEEHQTCPHYEETEERQHSNPIEAARMTKYNL